MSEGKAPSLYDDLSDRIQSNPSFQADLRHLQRLEALRAMGRNDSGLIDLSAKQIARLAQTAVSFACSSHERNQALAYQISHLLVTTYSDEFPGLSNLAQVVFSRVGNSAAEKLLPIADDVYLPAMPHFERSVRKVLNRIVVGETEYFLTDFQSQVLAQLATKRSISISAPTSAGKSFLITRFIVQRFIENVDRFRAAIVVPTRALIRQFQRDLQTGLQAAQLDDVTIITTSIMARTTSQHDRVLYIMTQERLQATINDQDGWSIDLLVVDEAQKLNDNNRGIILDSTLFEILKQPHETQVIFISPLANDPESLLPKFPIPMGEALTTRLSPVTQNLFDLRVKRSKIELSLLTDTGPINIIQDEAPPSGEDLSRREELLSYVALKYSGRQSSIVYCNSAADAETVATSLRRRLSDSHSGPLTPPHPVTRITDFLKDYIHPKYNLIEALQHGIGVHYGDMPEVVRHAVEQLFIDREIDYLCCTSTLLEGVNLPAKNIFVYRPLQGGRDMDDSSFWNLAGRAGRFMNDFAGNVYCINQNEWKRPVDAREQTYSLNTALQRALEDPDLSAYILSGAVHRDKRHHFQQALSYLLPRFVQVGKGGLWNQLEGRGLTQNISNSQLTSILSAVEMVAKDIQVPADLLKANTGVDPRQIERLRRYLSSLSKHEIRQIVPLHPASSGFYDQLQRMFQVLDQYLALRAGESYKYFALLANAWIRETSLREIIARKIEFQRKRETPTDETAFVNTCIRDVIKDLNKYIRFEYVKFTKCFVDLLREIFSKEELGERFDPDLPGYLEVGAYLPTTLTLMNAGCSRMTAALVTEMFRRSYSSGDIIEWLVKNREVVARSLPTPCVDDLSLVLASIK